MGSLPLLLLVLSLSVSLTGCVKKQNTSPQPTPEPTTIRVGSSVFHFDYKKAQSLVIDKADPVSGDHWMARVERVQSHPGDFFDDDPWRITSYSENAELPDRLANRTWILHLLDTLSTLHPVKEVSPGGADADAAHAAARANDGLTPPLYALRWKVWDQQSGQTKTFQVEIGASVEEGSGFNRLSYGSFPPNPAIYELDGAALEMLEYIKTFSALRQQTLSSLASDEVEELEIDRPGRAAFYAQRDGDVWADKKHRPWKKNVQGFLDRITHLRIEKFLDDPTVATQFKPSLDRGALAVIVLKGHFSKPTTLRFARRGSHALATASTRPGAVFELYPSALSQLSP